MNDIFSNDWTQVLVNFPNQVSIPALSSISNPSSSLCDLVFNTTTTAKLGSG